MQEGKSVGIWIRVSTEDQARGESPEHHEKRARYYAESKEWIVKEVYHLEAVSGKSVMEHPETQRMLSHINSGHISGLIFSKLARLARNTRELLDFADIFREHNADLISLQESIDTSTPAGRLFYTMIAAMAQWEREEIASRVAASVPIRAKLGKSLGGAAPYGYQWVDKKLVPNPKEAPIRKLMYELFVEHKRRRTVARMLNERGCRTRNGSKFSDTTVGRLLTDPSAKGLRRANYTKSLGQKKHWRFKPPSEWIFIEVEPIVSRELWEDCKRILEEQRKKERPPARRAIHLFTSFAFCHCGGKMHVPYKSPNYHCRKCKNYISAADLEAVYHEQLKSFVFSEAEMKQYFNQAEERLGEKEHLLETLAAEAKAVKEQMDNMVKLYLAGEMAQQGFGRHYQPLEERLGQIEEQLPVLQGEIDFLKIQYLSNDEVLAEAKDLYSRWETLETAEKRKIIETITEQIIVGDGEITINLLSPLPSSNPPTKNPPSTPSLPPLKHPQFGNATSGLRCQSTGRVVITAKRPKSAKFPKSLITMGDHIRAKRLKLKLLQKDVAKLIGVDETTIYNWERGYSRAPLRYMPTILEFLGYDPVPDEPKTLGDKLLKYRKKRGLTQKALAREIGIDPATMSRLERNKRGCFSATVNKVSVFLQIRIAKDSLAGLS
jgi:site-specific DNA recombinase